MNSRGRSLVVFVVAVLSVAATARLGFWQLSRASEKLALQATLDQRGALPELGVTALAATALQAEAQHYRRVRLRGQWVQHATVFLDNRQMNSRQGFFVLTPLKLAGRNDAVLVQRGWAPRNANDRALLPQVPTPAEDIEVQGLVAPEPGRLYDFGSAESGSIRQNLTLDAFGRETGLALLPLTVLMSDSPSAAGDGLARHWPPPALDIDHHYGYAFQWFAMCAVLAALYVWFQLLRPRLGKNRRSDVDSASFGPAEPPTK